jgi:hypothetical protein
MIAADMSTGIAFLEGEKAVDTELLDQALRDRQLLIVPVVLTELLSDPKLSVEVAKTLSDVPTIGIEYWQRAGTLRAKVLAKRRRARLGAADTGISPLTRDRDFRAFTEAAGLKRVV